MKYLFAVLMIALGWNSAIAQDKSKNCGVMLRSADKLQPLILLDGSVVEPTWSTANDSTLVPQSMRTHIGLEQIDPDTIESIIVAKSDADKETYASRYGLRAKNGVVIITTKKASLDKIQKE